MVQLYDEADIEAAEMGQCEYTYIVTSMTASGL